MTQAEVVQFLNRELIPVLRELISSLLAAPIDFAWSSNAATVDLSRSAIFAASNALTGDSALTLQNGREGLQGTLLVRQDGVGNRELTIAAEGRTTLRVSPDVDDFPNPAANSATLYRYAYVTAAGTPYLLIEKLYLL